MFLRPLSRLVRGSVFRSVPAFTLVLFFCACSPPTYNRMVISITTGTDDARSASEITATIEGQKRAVCLKASSDPKLPFDKVCPQGLPSISWDNWSTHTTDPLVLDTPQKSAPVLPESRSLCVKQEVAEEVICAHSATTGTFRELRLRFPMSRAVCRRKH